MEWLAWVVLLGGFILGKSVLHLQLGSPQRAIFGLIVCGITMFLAWKGVQKHRLNGEPVTYALSPLIVAGIGALYFFLSFIGGAFPSLW